MEEVLNEVFMALVAAIVGYVALLARRYVKDISKSLEGQLNEEARLRLERAFENAIARAEDASGRVDLHEVVEYVQEFNPGDLARMRLAGSRLQKRAAAAIAARKPAQVATTTERKLNA